MSKAILTGSKKMSQSLNNVLSATETNLNQLLDNVYIGVSVKVFLVLYAALAAPQLPKNLALALDSTIMRVIFASLIIFAAINDPVTAILLAVAFIITLQTAAKYKLIDTSENVVAPGGLSWLPSARNGAVVDKAGNIEMGEMALSRVGSVAGGVVGGLENVTGGVLDGAGHVVSGVTGGVRDIGSGVLSGGQQLINAGADTASGLTTGAIGSVRTVGGSVIGGAREVGSGLIGGVSQAGSGLVGGVSTLGGCLLDSAEQVGSGLLGGAEQVGQGVIGGARQVGTGLIGGTREAGVSVLDGADTAASGIIGATRDVTGGIYGAARGLTSSAVNATRSTAKGTISGGKAMLGGMVEHMENPPAAAEKVQSCPFAPYMNEQEIESMGSNIVPGVDQGNCVMTFKNQNCIQGAQSNAVIGY